jgi:pseudaminic acid cytidylyltransferase
MNCLAIITARGGSKRIFRKNIKKFLGKPIIAYSIETALESKLFKEVMVSTDDYEIARIAKKYGANVPFLRSIEASSDYAAISDACIEVIGEYLKNNKEFEYICCLLPTAPLMKKENLKKAARILNEKKVDCVFTITEYNYPIQRSLEIRNGFVSMVWPQNVKKRSQDLSKRYHDAGQFYFIKSNVLLAQKKFFVKNSKAIILKKMVESQDIDTLDDWEMAKIKYKILKNEKI